VEESGVLWELNPAVSLEMNSERVLEEINLEGLLLITTGHLCSKRGVWSLCLFANFCVWEFWIVLQQK